MGARLGVPILRTQHLPPSFMPYFAMQLGRMTPMRVKVAEEADILLANHIYIATGEANLTCRRRSGGRTSTALDNRRAPFARLQAVNSLFASMAEVFVPAEVAVGSHGLVGDAPAEAS